MGNDDCISVGMFSSHSKYLIAVRKFHFDIVSTVCSYNTEKEVEDRNTTVFTSWVDGEIFLKPNRPALVVSSTSWSVLLIWVILVVSLFILSTCG